MSVMKKVLLPAMLGLGLYSQVSLAATQTYAMDPGHTSVVVAWTHFGFSHPTADLSNVTGTIVFDADDLAKSKVDVTLPISTIDTHVAALTSEFKGAEYFDVAKYPTATFHSTKVTHAGDNKYDVEGNLTIKGITKPVTLHAVLNKQGEHPMVKKQAIGFDAAATIKRSDFKLDKYVPAVSDDVVIAISTEAYAK
ncbi:YceI family protein [Nissabacter sp. SGAir0207]|uniref:YceI family protein n=1 Tax=Nissabacter sp. SGAir0207 TaxID=2126321 RepID=UPI0010CD413E|nr:YceI family protein [Nissabacter sp. SGAir0207]QCR36618.1 polyisoprenoid-binding protein [Nissabacter sp. SGAir0207]